MPTKLNSLPVVQLIAKNLDRVNICSFRLVSREMNQNSVRQFIMTGFEKISTDLLPKSLHRLEIPSSARAVTELCFKGHKLQIDPTVLSM